MIRYGFTIRSRTGQRIENVSIIAGSQNDAERRLRQMYLQCEILECRERSIPRRFEAANVANMIDRMSISPPTIQHHGHREAALALAGYRMSARQRRSAA